MEGIIKRRVLSDVLTVILGISAIGEDLHLLHVYVIEAKPVLYHLVPVDFDISQYKIDKKR